MHRVSRNAHLLSVAVMVTCRDFGTRAWQELIARRRLYKVRRQFQPWYGYYSGVPVVYHKHIHRIAVRFSSHQPYEEVSSDDTKHEEFQKESPHTHANNKNEHEYFKLPRLYVGKIPTLPTYVDTIKDIPGLGNETGYRGVPVCRLNELIHLTPEQSHYLTTVMRLFKKGKGSQPQHIRIFDSHNGDWLARVVTGEALLSNRRSRSSDVLTVQCVQQLQTRLDSVHDQKQSSVWLFVAPPKKKDRWRWMVEKAVELGVDGFAFLESDRSESVEQMQLPKLVSHVIEASEQCERPDIPCILSFANIDTKSTSKKNEASVISCAVRDLLLAGSDQLSNTTTLLICRERRNSVPIWHALTQTLSSSGKDAIGSTGHHAIIILIGPEGGWSPVEEEQMDAFESTCPDRVCNVSLGSNVLRSETAALAAVAAYHSFQNFRINPSQRHEKNS